LQVVPWDLIALPIGRADELDGGSAVLLQRRNDYIYEMIA
jgi:hypothetical protein